MNITDGDAKQWGVIYRAIKDGKLEEVIKHFDEHPETFGWIGPFGPWLHIAAKEGQVPIMKELLRRGADLQAIGGIAEDNALCSAIQRNQYEAAVFLLDLGIEIETAVPNSSPLFTAILGDRVNMLQLLVDRGINTEPENWDPVFEAKRESAARCLALLQKVKAEKHARSKGESK